MLLRHGVFQDINYGLYFLIMADICLLANILPKFTIKNVPSPSPDNLDSRQMDKQLATVGKKIRKKNVKYFFILTLNY